VGISVLLVTARMVGDIAGGVRGAVLRVATHVMRWTLLLVMVVLMGCLLLIYYGSLLTI
jgi:hypothetical protein